MAQPEAFGLINVFGALGQLAVNRVRRHLPNSGSPRTPATARRAEHFRAPSVNSDNHER